MPRIISALAIAAALVIGVFIIKNKQSAPPTAMLIAEQIQNANQSSLEAYAAELAASGTASDTSFIIPPPTLDVTATTTSGPLLPPTATDKLAQNILETYVNAKQSGVDISSDVATQIADNILSQPYTDSSSAKIYSANNLTIEKTPSKQDMKNYGNAVGEAFSPPLPAGDEDELTIFSSFAASNDNSVLAKLTPNIARYQKIVSALAIIPVPAPFVQTHIDLVNALSAIAYDVQKMQNFPADPVGAENGVQDYEASLTSLGTALRGEKSLFLSNGITFSASDPGDFLTQ